MATVTHHIYSHYDPRQREALERSTGQVTEQRDLGDPEEDPWQTESSFGAQRRLAAAPRFVPAVVSYDEINNMIAMPQELLTPNVGEKPKTEVGSWYRSLPRSSSVPAEISHPRLDISSPRPAISTATNHLKPTRPTNGDWFIARALRSEPPTGRSTPTQTLADILSRDPPPDSSKSFTPPILLHLGPSNKGYSMMEKSGWNEGEPLGVGALRWPREPEERSLPFSNVKAESRRMTVKQAQQEVKWDLDGDISEIRKVEVVDLTLTDEEDFEMERTDGPSASTSTFSTDLVASHNPKALLTPLPTVLKSDRLGVGLKAKTVGPYKASKKRVTHNQAALAEHVRATEEMRRMKALAGRGSKGFARLARADSENRRRLLQSLNDP